MINNLLAVAVLFCCTLFVWSCTSDHNKDSGAPTYDEPHRPQLHFSPPANWMNDPNGMVFFEGEYHLFYQYYPDSTVWGPMHWGHAITKDLIHWEHLPIALYPDEKGLIFSGSAVVDWDNTSGFGQGGEPPLVAIFTYHNMAGEQSGANDFQSQAIAYSNDRGRTWTKYAGNPVVANPGIRDFRDPKVIWDQDTKQWVMVFAAYDHVKFYTSPDLKNWQYLSDFGQKWGTHGGVWECPDLFPQVDSGTGNKKWVLLVSVNPGSPNGGSGTQYFIGEFDGKQFHLDQEFITHLGTRREVVPTGVVLADFENGYGDWVATGKAFGDQPAKGTLPPQNTVTLFRGSYLANSCHGGDASTGTLTSPAFVIDQPFLNFQTAGGNHPGETAVNLVIDGKVVRSATGNNSERLAWTHWDLQDLQGRKAKIQLVDNHTGAWGHLCADHFLLADQVVQPTYEKAVWLDYGWDNYAGVTWSNVAEEDGRRIFMGWMSNWDYANVVPTQLWRSAMTLPRVLTVSNTPDGPRIFQSFPGELKELRGPALSTTSTPNDTTFVQTLAVDPRQLEIRFEAAINDDSKSSFGFKLSNADGESYRIGYDAARGAYFSNRTKAGKIDFSDRFANSIHYAPKQMKGALVTMQVVFDRASAELIADDGLTALTDIFFPTTDFSKIELFVEGQNIHIQTLDIYPLVGIWGK